MWCEPVGLCVGDWAWLSSSGWGPMVPLALHPQDLLLGWSQLWEWWQMSNLILVVDWLSLSIYSSNMEVAASACLMGLPGLSKFLFTQSVLSLSLSLSLSGRLCPDGMDKHWVPAGSSSLLPSDCSPLLHHRWSFKEDKMSLVTSTCSFGPAQWGSGQPL